MLLHRSMVSSGRGSGAWWSKIVRWGMMLVCAFLLFSPLMVVDVLAATPPNQMTAVVDAANAPLPLGSFGIPGPSGSVFDIFNFIIQILAGIVSTVVLFRVVYSAFLSISGKEDDIKDRNTIMRNAAIGLVIVIMSGMIASGFLSVFYGGNATRENTQTLLPSTTPTAGPGLSLVTSDMIKAVDEKTKVPTTSGKLESCGQLSYFKRLYPQTFYNPAFRESYLGLLINCGEANPILYDSKGITKYVLSFLYNILGTLMVIALLIAGFMYIFDKTKDAEEGRKRLQMIFVGALLTMVAAPLVQILISLITTTTS